MVNRIKVILKNFMLPVLSVLVISSCANRVIPGGGKVDHRAPVLQETSPAEGALNFSGKEIVITFDEYVQLKNAGDAIAISPPIEPAPRAVIRKRSVVVELSDSLQPNTTYTIDFGDAIADVNEGNPVPGYRFVFSTGNVIDTLTMSGTIYDALTMKPVPGALAVAFPENIPDSMLAVTRPSYFARAGNNGNFTISNMREGSYRVFGLDDANGNLRANLPDEGIGFLDGPVAPGAKPLLIRISRHLPLKQHVVSSKLTEPGRLEVALARPLSDPSWNFISPLPDTVISALSERGDTLSLVFIPRSDTVQVLLSDAGAMIDTVTARLSRGSNEALAAGRYMMWKSEQGNVLVPGTDPAISWMVPLTVFDSSKVEMSRDTIPVAIRSFHNIITGTNTRFAGEWKPGNYRITLLPGAASDIFGRQNDTIPINFIVPDERAGGSLSYILPETSSRQLLQLTTEKDEVKRQVVVPESGKGIFMAIEPGVYKLRLIDDANGNGRWDTGNFRTQLQPEKVTIYPETITVRANWELEIVWDKK